MDYHLDSNAEDGLKIEFASALLEEIFQTFSEEVHDHDMEGLIIISLFVSHEMQVWHACYNKL